MRHRLMLAMVAALLMLTATSTAAQSTITVSNDQASLEFPERLTFSADFNSDTPIEKVVLEYGVDQLTCGKVIAKAFPQIEPGQQVTAEWTWEMKQSGSQPPGSKIWWRWRITDQNGLETVTNPKETVWLDDQHDWQTVAADNINLHWYEGEKTFGNELHQSAVKALADLARVTGVQTDHPIDLYIYGNFDDMRDAVLYEPGWTGGLAYADHHIVIIGIAPDQLDWGKRTEAHELTHVLVGQLTFSCLSDIPTWLQEGLAVYGEGGLDGASREQFDQAVRDDTLLSVRALSGGFSEDPAKADISYSQSYSLINFLIEKHGSEKMLEFLGALRDGWAVDEALQRAYGFDSDGFEDAWRAAIGARPRTGDGAAPTATPQPTVVPTIAPISIGQTVPTLSPTRGRPTPTPIVIAQAGTSAASNSAPVAESTPTDSTAIMVIVMVGVLTILFIIVVIVSRRKQRMNL